MGELDLTGAWFVWSLALGVSFPLLVILLGEVAHRLEQRGKALAGAVRAIRNSVLPSLVVLLLVSEVLGFGKDHAVYRYAATLFWIFVIHSTLSILNIVLFAEAEESSWRSRVPALLRDLSRFFLVMVGAAFVLSTVWGADLGGLLTALGVGSIVLGLALQDTLGNMFSGITLLFERPLRLGDWLQLSGRVGRVIEINWRAIHLHTPDDELLIIPNLVLSKEVLANFSYPEPRYTQCLRFSFSYEDPPSQVKRVLEQVASDVPWVLREPGPTVIIEELGERMIHYKVKLRIDGYEHSEEARDAMASRVWYAARRHGLTLEPPPELPETLQVELPAEASPREWTPGSDSATVLSRLRQVPVFHQVDLDILEKLLAPTRIEVFGQEEHVLHQGGAGEDFFIVLDGEVAIRQTGEDGREAEIARLGPGEYFGEIAILRDEPTSASVVATCDTEVAAIPSAALHGLLEAVPRLARQIGKAIEERRSPRRSRR